MNFGNLTGVELLNLDFAKIVALLHFWSICCFYDWRCLFGVADPSTSPFLFLTSVGLIMIINSIGVCGVLRLCSPIDGLVIHTKCSILRA